ncbi:hypothetical protein DMB66_12405 [Actinoplanes sp. ATCC 53533]|nr:hypothetical protein DMB66_12405 [Actinoplanes sp. ATCC 53533]
MSKSETRGHWWITYIAVPIAVHSVLYGLVRTEQFAGGPLEHSYVRIGISVVAVVIVGALMSLRRASSARAT